MRKVECGDFSHQAIKFLYDEDVSVALEKYKSLQTPLSFNYAELIKHIQKEKKKQIKCFLIRVSSIKKMVTVSKSRVKLLLEPGSLETIVSTERSGRFKKWLVGEA